VPGQDNPERARLASELGVEPQRLAGLDPELVDRVLRRIDALAEAAAVDDLTGVLRRRAGLDALEREIQRARRHGDRRLVVAFVDGAALRRVNNLRGHAAGDAVVRELAGALRRRLRAYDLVVRWGGDEFVCALSQAGLEQTERVMADVDADFAGRTGCHFRFGLAQIEPGEGAEALIARADADLYARRRRGGSGAQGRERCGESKQNLQGRSLHSPA
jgi:diguanylate cyclase (GGDEF)-like protein